tara:strand:- start:255 stop:584 length:330 start_codon:yes stop_codon:yes gene_type:complete
MSEVDILKYREMTVQFINTNKENLVSIYTKHSKGNEENEGEGILLINFNEYEKTKNIDVSFIALKLLSDELINEINKYKANNNENIIYFLVMTPYEDKIIEIDIKQLIS